MLCERLLSFELCEYFPTFLWDPPSFAFWASTQIKKNAFKVDKFLFVYVWFITRSASLSVNGRLIKCYLSGGSLKKGGELPPSNLLIWLNYLNNTLQQREREGKANNTKVGR